MSTPAPNNINEPSRMKKILSSNVDESIKSRLPRGNGATVPTPAAPQSAPTPVSAAQPAEAPLTRRRLQIMPAFWTIASLMSISVNVVMLAVILVLVQMLGGIQTTADDQISGLLGGLYQNFVKMDQASIISTIPVDANIPLNIVVPVQATTQIRLAETVTIPNAHVRINTGTLNIDAAATVTLPANTPLMVNLDFPLTVQNSIPIHLDVPVNIPLNQTQLHEPFVGLQKVVEPWYCLIEPNALVNGVQVCTPTSNP